MSRILDDFVALYEWDFANGVGDWIFDRMTFSQMSGFGRFTIDAQNGQHFMSLRRQSINVTFDSVLIINLRPNDSTIPYRLGISINEDPAVKYVDYKNVQKSVDFSDVESQIISDGADVDLNLMTMRLSNNFGDEGNTVDVKSIGIYRRKTPYEGFVPSVTWDFTNDLQGWVAGGAVDAVHDSLGFMHTKITPASGSKYVSRSQTVLQSYPLFRMVIASPNGSVLNGRLILRRRHDNQNVIVNFPPVTVGIGYQEVFVELPDVESGSQILFVDVGQNVGDEFHIKSIEYGRLSVRSITLTPKNLNIGIGHQWQIEAETFPIDPANPTLTWSSSDPSVTVVNGLVTGVSLGEATITALADNGITASCQVSVVELKPRSAGETPTGGMRVRRLNKNGDWTFGSGRSNYATGSEAIYQCVLTALLSFRGDWFLDLDHGIPWFNYLRKNPDLMAMENSVKGAVLGVTGVERITEFDINLNPDTRVATVSVSYIDTFGLENGVTTDVNDNR